MKNHKYTSELIYHFTCGKCSQWWSYASSENGSIPDEYEMNCPHCGHETTVEPKEEN